MLRLWSFMPQAVALRRLLRTARRYFVSRSRRGKDEDKEVDVVGGHPGDGAGNRQLRPGPGDGRAPSARASRAATPSATAPGTGASSAATPSATTPNATAPSAATPSARAPGRSLLRRYIPGGTNTIGANRRLPDIGLRTSAGLRRLGRGEPLP